MGEKEIVLIVVLIVLAVFLHIFSVCGWYRRGFDEGYEKGLASRKEPLTEPPVYGMQKRNIETLNYFYSCEPSEAELPKEVIDAELNNGILEQIKPFIRKHETVNDFGFGKCKKYHAELKVVDERGEALNY
jgi:hypothetical protein